MSVPRLYVPSASVDLRTIVLPEDEAHHATRVLRLGPGDEVRVFDGRGHEWAGRIVESARRRDVLVELDREFTPVVEPSVKVTLAIGLLKGDQMDAVVRDATALGVTTIVPMVTEHVTVPERAWRSGAALERWQRVAVASSKQCGRAVVPDIGPVATFSDVVARHFTAKFICVEPRAASGEGRLPDRGPTTALVLVGPEGGWASTEIEAAKSSGTVPISCGPRTLRAETMPVVVLSSMWSVFGW